MEGLGSVTGLSDAKTERGDGRHWPGGQELSVVSVEGGAWVPALAPTLMGRKGHGDD